MNLRNRTFVRIVQIIFGLYLIFLGLIGYFVELPTPQYNEAGLAFLGALFNTGYIFHLVSMIFVLSGLMFIFSRWSAFGAVLLTPITFNILLFHIFLDFTNFWFALIPIILNLYLIVIHWSKYRMMFSK
ncbi:MAG: DoxX protein [Nanoarchaeota archaeon]